MKTKLKLSVLMPVLAKEIQAGLLELLPDDAKVETIDVKRAARGDAISIDKDEERTILLSISTRDMDRDQEILVPKGVDFRDFMRADGPILTAHNYTKLPVGKTVQMAADDQQVVAKIKIAPTPDGDLVWTLAKFMKMSASVGFMAMDRIMPGHDEWEKTVSKYKREWPEFGKVSDTVRSIVRKWALLEVSIVPVPANPHAVSEDVSKAVKDGKITAEEAAVCRKAFDIPETIVDHKELDGPLAPKIEPPKPPEPPEPKAEPRRISLATVIMKAPASVVHEPSMQDLISEAVKKALDKKRGLV